MRSIARVSVLAIAIATPMSAAGAQDQASGIGQTAERAQDDDTILVTASRSGTELSDLPISTSVVSEEELAEQLDFSTNIMRALEFTVPRSEEHTSELQSLMRISYAVFCLNKKK